MKTRDKEQNETAKLGSRRSFTRVLKIVVSLVRQRKGIRLEKFLTRLPAAEVYWIETIMYLGTRSGQRVADIRYNYEYLSRGFPPEDAIRNILEKGPTPLDSYIETGIKMLKRHKVDIDSLPRIATPSETDSNPAHGE